MTTCQRKQAFYKKGWAEDALKRLRKQRGNEVREVRVYRCNSCGCFHLGTPKSKMHLKGH